MKLKILLLLLLFASGISNSFAQINKELKTEEDGYQWYLVSFNGARGAQDINGKEIVPLSKKFEWVNYDNGFLCGTIFSPDDDLDKIKNAYYDKKGNVIIALGRYDMVSYNAPEDGKPAWFSVKKNGLHGACGITGKEIVPPVYKGLLYDSKGFKGEKNEAEGFEPLNILLPNHDIMAFVEKKQKTESNGFVWYELQDYPNYGAANKDGKVLLPMSLQLTRIKYVAPTKPGKRGFFEVYRDDNVGVYNIDGEEILSPNKGYTYWSYEGDNEQGYFQVNKGDLKYGFCDLNQHEIIAPGKYSYAHYNVNGFFKVKKGNYEGICDLNGKELIAPNKYTSISHINFSDEPHWFSVKKDGFEGAYSMAGNELVPALYKDLYYDNDEGFYYEDDNGNDIALNVKIESDYSNGNSEYLKNLFNQAYNTPDSEAQTKFDLYVQVIEADAGNKEGYQVVAYNNIGSLYESLGDLKNARAYYEKSLQIQPSYELAQKNLKRIKNQQRFERLNNFANALGQAANELGNANTLQNGNSYNNGTIQNNVNASGSKQIRKVTTRKCTHCAGTGECKTCMGRGYILGKVDQEWRPCPSCNYGGTASKEKKGKCTFCKGTGYK